MTTTQVHIKVTCNYCNGQAYLPIGKLIYNDDSIYTRYLPCPQCQGTGLIPKWVSLLEFIKLTEAIDVMEPDYGALEREEPTSQFQDSRDAAGL